MSEENLVRFCLINKNGQPYEIIDSAIADEVINSHEIIIMAGQPWIYEGGVYRKDDKGLHIQDYVKNLIIKRLRTDSRISRVYRLILKDIRLQFDLEDTNKYPKSWTNFKNGMLDILSGEMHPHSPEYKSISQIPHNYYPNLNIEESVFHKFLSSRVDRDNQIMLYEALGHTLLSDIVFQKFLILVGKGNNGKSVILNHLTRILGKENVDKVADVLATAIKCNLNIYDLENLELCYAPPFSSAKSIPNILGNAIENEIKGLVENISWEDLENLSTPYVLDARTKREYETGHFKNAINIPVDELRENLDKLNKNNLIYVYCRTGVRSYISCRILTQNGFHVKNILGGYNLYNEIKKDRL